MVRTNRVTIRTRPSWIVVLALVSAAVSGLALAALAALPGISSVDPASAAPASPTPQVETEPVATVPAETVPAETASPSPTEELERAKLEQEVRKLRLENERAAGPLGVLLAFAPFVTVIVAVVSLGAALWKQSSELAAARTSAADEAARWQREFTRQQALDAAAADKERLGRFDDSLGAIAAQISSENPGLSLNGAAALGLFAKPLYADLHADLLRIVIANLRAKPSRQVSSLLRDHLSRVLRLLFAEGRAVADDLPAPIDLTHLDLYRLDLQGVRLPRGVILDLAFADLKEANLTEMTMDRARAYEAKLDGARFSRTHMDEARFNAVTATEAPANFHEASLVSATFDHAVLPRAEFQRARLQGAKFRHAELSGARFEGAQFADAYFQGAVLDEPALRSIALNAHEWQQAHFDPDVRSRLDDISAEVDAH